MVINPNLITPRIITTINGGHSDDSRHLQYGSYRRIAGVASHFLEVDLGGSQLDEHLEQTCVVLMPLREHSGLGAGHRA